MAARQHRVELSPAAERDLRSLPLEVLRRLRPRIDTLATNPRPPGVKKLEGEEALYRLRVGDYRVTSAAPRPGPVAVHSPDRRYHRRLERWLQPGGHIDPDDVDIFATARREVAEETGVAGLPAPGGLRLFDLDVHPIPPRPGEPAHEHFDVRVLFRAAATALRPASDARSARWVGFDEVAALGADASVRRAVAKLRAGAA